MAKVCGSNTAGPFVFVLFRTIVMFIFVALVPVASLFSFFQVAVAPMLETTKLGCLIPVETCFFFANRKFWLI